jgi:hypothetical protein
LKDVDPIALVDSGAQGRFVDESIIGNGKKRKLKKPIIVRNVDGTRNAAGRITHELRVQYAIGNQEFDEWFLITSLGDQKMILGMPWLKDHNPEINWKRGTLKIVDWSREQGRSIHQITQAIRFIRREEQPIEGAGLLDESAAASFVDHENTWIRAKELANYLGQDSEFESERVVKDGTEETTWVRVKQSNSQRFAQKATETKKDVKLEVPPEFAKWKTVFEKKESDRLPEHRPWDLKIIMKPGFVKRKSPLYEMPPKLQPIFDEWLQENLRKGYIRPSESSQSSGFFFIEKKVKKEYRPCMDYRDLNEGTVKDTYPLPLVNDLMLKLRGAKYFTKLDLRWGYNNVRI